LDFSEKCKIIKDCLDHETGHIRSDLEEEGFEKLMRSLEITRNDIENSLNDSGLKESDISGSLLVLRTDWRKNFGARVSDLNNQFFEFRHPFLINPFLELETIKWLVEDINPQLKGIGTDSPSLNDPICYIRPESLPRYSRRYYNKYKKYSFRPFSIYVLNNYKYYIKNMVNLGKCQANGIIPAKTLLIPFYLNLRDACPAKLYFIKGG
jgi:kynurenine formamidase